MNTITKLSIWKNSVLAVIFITAEVIGIGPISRYRVGECYTLLTQTGAPLLWLIVYMLFCFVWPVIDLLAIIVKPRLTINNLGFPER
ncbi:MAG: hypothetical protein AB1772_13150 [Candidatus Zixiibacteriota bacterium]